MEKEKLVRIDFSKLPCFVDINKAAKMPLNVQFDFANTMYMHGSGVAMGALAMKIYNSKGEEDYNENECKLILDMAAHINPMLFDSLSDIINVKPDSTEK